MVNPVPGHAVTQPYRKTGSSWTTCGYHTGQDYAASAGTPVVAARAGVVAYVNYGSAFGAHQFAIRPGDGTEDFYAHTRTRPPSGRDVIAGEWVAEVGAEGNTTGPHLHFERHKSYGWGCSLLDDPMKSHNHGGGTTDGEEPLMAGHLATFFTHKGTVYEADLAAGTYWAIPNSQTLTDRKAMLTRAGIPWFDWDTSADVGNPAAFGRLVG